MLNKISKTVAYASYWCPKKLILKFSAAIKVENEITPKLNLKMK